MGLYGLVSHNGTSSLTGLKPYHHFFLTTAIRRNNFVVNKRVFWAQNITHAFDYSAPQPLSWLGRGVGGMEGDRKTPKERGIGPYRYFFSTLWALVGVIVWWWWLFQGVCPREEGCAWLTQAVKCCELTPRWPTRFLVGSTRVACFLFDCVFALCCLFLWCLRFGLFGLFCQIIF